MQSRHYNVEDELIRLVVSSGKDGNDDGVTTTTTTTTKQLQSGTAAATVNREHQRHVCEFYLGNTNVTPREIISAKYPKQLCEENQCKNRLLSMTHTYNWSHENYYEFFLKIDAKTIDDLLDDVLLPSRRPAHFDGKETDGAAVNERDVIRPGGGVSSGNANDYREVELTESPTILILHVPNNVTVEGDGDYERIQKTNDIYRNNCARTRLKTDSVTQTINPCVDRKNEECQTLMLSASTVGTQVNAFDIVDVYAEADKKRSSAEMSTAVDARNGEMSGNSIVDNDADAVFDKTAMFVIRIAAQNSLMNAEQMVDDPLSARTVSVGLAYCFELELNRAQDENGLAVRCTHWNETETHLLAVAYSKSIYDGAEGKPNVVAVWSMKNPYTPERFYEFNESAITCIRFSTECPNRLAVGFHSGEILIIDISSESLQIVYQKSKQSSLEINGILGMFWTVRVENGLSRVSQFECLVTCNTSGSIERYRYWNDTFERKKICENDSLVENDEQLVSNAKKYSKSICNATKFFGLDQKTYLVGTGDGLVYTCKYDNLRCRSTKTMAHLGVIKSLEKSPYSPDVYLTTGCDCSIKIWIGDIFVEPVIILNADGQIEKAIWSRTNSTVIVSVVDNCLHVWDIDVKLDSPISVRELRISEGHECSDVEFTLDGKRLCVSDTSGKVVVYDWSDVSEADGRVGERKSQLMCCIAKSLYGKTYLSKMLRKERPEYVDVFAAVYDEQQ